MRIGLIVNPVAGLGGAVGLKGTDGPGTVAEALALGAVPQAGPRARRALTRLAARVPGARLTVASGIMGADWAAGLPLDLTVVGGTCTGTARDTRAAVAAMAGVHLIAFAGGDGTARDVAAAVEPGTAILGIPSGVKMHSGVFALSPEAAGAILADCLSGPDRVVFDDEAEVTDIDETALRAGHLAPKLYGLARVPSSRARMQAAKGGPRQDAAAALRGAAAEVAREMEPGTLYVVGPGTSAGAVMHEAGHTPTLLGVDALRDNAVLARDARAAELERLMAGGPARLVLGITGRQGFLLGRGNQQIGPDLIARAGRDGLILLGTEAKLAALAQPRLWIDTGNPDLDAALAGYVRVRTGAGRATLMRMGPSD